MTTLAEAAGTPSAPAATDIAKFERMLAGYLAGTVEEEEFRVFRLNNGVYGQRQGGHNQMVRVKAPYGSLTSEQLEVLGTVAERYSRGWGHLTTRQNIQFHFVPLERIPELLRHLAAVGLTTREACGDTVRNITACHLAGACPFEVLDVSPWADAAFHHFLRHPYAQRLPRKFKINFSGCSTDCGQATFNDVGVVAVNRPTPDGTLEPGFRVFLGGGLGANPHSAQALEEFTPRQQLLPTIEAVLRTFDHYGNRDNKLRARMKWLLDTMGIDELRARILKERKLLVASSSWPGGIPVVVEERGDEPAGIATGTAPSPVGMPVTPGRRPGPPYERWKSANVVFGVAKGTVSAIAAVRLGDVTGEQFRGLASIQREFGTTMRVTNRQNFGSPRVSVGELT
jgi:sulfite reductase beta subunit-like hemoprotein